MATSAISEYGSISPKVGTHASLKALYTARKQMVFYRFSEQETVPKNASTQVLWREWGDLDAAVAPLQGSITPSGSEMPTRNVTTTLRQYGRWIPIPKYVADTIDDPLLQRATDRLGYNMKLTYDTLDFYVARQGSQVVFANGVAGRSSVVAIPSLDDLRRCVAILEAGNAEPFTSIIDPNPKVGTRGIEESYFAVFHSYQASAIRTMSGFLPVAAYPDKSSVVPGEFGSVENVRFVRSNVIEKWAGKGGASTSVMYTGSNADVWPIIIFAKGAMGTVKLEGTEFNKILVHNAQVEGSDPLSQRGSVGWIGWYSSVILQNTKMVRLEGAAKLA